jgi:hypothetical protein
MHPAVPHALPKGLPLMPLFRGKLGAKGEMGLETRVKQGGLLSLDLCRQGLDRSRIGRLLFEQRPQLLSGGNQALKTHPCRRALRFKQGTDVTDLLIRQPQAGLGAMPEDLRHGGAVLRREEGGLLPSNLLG